MEAMIRPRVRTIGLVFAAFDGELLVQDTRRHRAHALNRQAAAIFRLANGTHTVEEMAVLASAETGETMTPEMAWYAVGLLQRLHLLEETAVEREDRITRKVLLKRVGTAVALASIASIAIPAAGAHASGCATRSCSNSRPCCYPLSCVCIDRFPSGFCGNGTCM